MAQRVPLTIVLGDTHTGKAIGYRVLNLDRTIYSAFTTTGVAESSVAGTYYAASGVVAPSVGGYIVTGLSGSDLAETTVEPDASTGYADGGTYTNTVLNELGAPVDGVRAELSTDSAGNTRVYQAFTNASGVFTLYPDVGTYYLWLEKAGYSFPQGTVVTVS